MSFISRFTVILGMSLLGSCIYDPDHPCGAHQTFKDGACLCEPTYRSNADVTGCIACGPHELGVSDSCVCEEGFSRATTDGPCMQLGEALGRSCDPTKNPCTDATYSLCYVPEDGSAPYCTKGKCTSSEDCGSALGCDVRAKPPICKKFPKGLGLSCTDNAACAAGEAKYCDTYASHVCLVDKCSSPEVTCYADSVCCDFSAVGASISVCVNPGNLEMGKCPLGGTIVPE